VESSVPDPKLLIADPDPLVENQAFQIWIRILENIQLRIRILPMNYRLIKIRQNLSYFGHKWAYFVYIRFFKINLLRFL